MDNLLITRAPPLEAAVGNTKQNDVSSHYYLLNIAKSETATLKLLVTKKLHQILAGVNKIKIAS